MSKGSRLSLVVDVAGGPLARAGLADVEVASGNGLGAHLAAVLCAVVELFWHLLRRCPADRRVLPKFARRRVLPFIFLHGVVCFVIYFFDFENKNKK